MLKQLPTIDREVIVGSEVSSGVQVNFEMTKSYQRFRLYPPNSNGFVVGLADFACLGWGLYDLAGYPYDDENAALFADWGMLSEDVKNAKEKLEDAKAG